MSTKVEWPSGKKMPVQIVGIGPPNGRQVHSELVEEAYKEYCEIFGKSQTLERLQERGGFDIVELATLLYMRIKRLEGKDIKLDDEITPNCKHGKQRCIKCHVLQIED